MLEIWLKAKDSVKIKDQDHVTMALYKRHNNNK